VQVWRDTADLPSGEYWREKIRQAITKDSLVFLACFSKKSLSRETSYQNEELILAIEQIRIRRPASHGSSQSDSMTATSLT
jgi:TIR domain